MKNQISYLLTILIFVFLSTPVFADDSSFEASINGTPVSTLEEAVEQANALDGQNPTLTLLTDVDLTSTIITRFTGTLDLGESTLTASATGNAVTVESGTLTIIGSSNGKISSPTNAIEVINDGNLNFDSGIIESGTSVDSKDGTGIIANGSKTVISVNGGTLTGKTAITINNGNTCYFKEGASINVSNAGATTSSGSAASLAAVTLKNGAVFEMTGGTITAHKTSSTYVPAIAVGNKNATTGATCTITGGTIDGDHGITVWNKALLSISGEETEISATGAYGYGIASNGSHENGNDASEPQIIITNGKIYGNSLGMFLPAFDGVTSITGGSITGGETGIEIRGGKLTVDGETTVTSTYTKSYKVYPNSSGPASYGAGIAVVQHTTSNPISVIVNNGEISGPASIGFAAPQDNDFLQDPADIQINKGIFIGPVNVQDGLTVQDVNKSEPFGQFIYGGTFTPPVDEDTFLNEVVGSVVLFGKDKTASYFQDPLQALEKAQDPTDPGQFVPRDAIGEDGVPEDNKSFSTIILNIGENASLENNLDPTFVPLGDMNGFYYYIAQNNQVKLPDVLNSEDEFKFWSLISASSGDPYISENTLCDIDTSVSDTYILKAIYASDMVTLSASVNPSNAGTINGETSISVTIVSGDSYPLEAVASEGFRFVNWTKNEEVVSDTPSFAPTVKQDTDYTANFEALNTGDETPDSPTPGQTGSSSKPSRIIVNVSNPNAGMGTVTGAGNYKYGQKVTLTATPKEGYEFLGWKDENGTGYVSTDNPYTFTARSSINLIAVFGPVSQNTEQTVTVYRLYNPVNGEHLFTSSKLEVSTLTSKYDWVSEEIGWYAPVSGKPVYRLYNPVLQNHLYTTDTYEVDFLTANEGWVKDFGGEPIFYAGGSVPIYRLYNPELNGAHLLTTNKFEYDTIPQFGWIQEGTAFTAVAAGSN